MCLSRGSSDLRFNLYHSFWGGKKATEKYAHYNYLINTKKFKEVSKTHPNSQYFSKCLPIPQGACVCECRQCIFYQGGYALHAML